MITVYVLICLISNSFGFSEVYDEQLVLTPYDHNELRADFKFKIDRNYTSTDYRDFLVFPRIIQELSDKYGISKLSLTMSQGRWYSNKWGEPPQPSGAAGAQIYTEFYANDSDEADVTLKSIVESLNGILCTSIAHQPIVAAPRLPILPQRNESLVPKIHKRFGVASSETTCTENLTRLRKLLACYENGIVSLLHPSKLYDGLYHSSSLFFVNKCEEGKCHISLEVGINVVFRKSSNKVTNWILSNVFDRKLSSNCKCARKSEIYLKHNKNVMVKPKGIEISEGSVYDLTQMNLSGESPLDIEISTKNIKKEAKNVFNIWSSQGGSDQSTGLLKLAMKNEDEDAIIYVSQIIPYFTRVRYSQIRFHCTSHDGTLIDGCLLQKEFISTKVENGPSLLQYKLKLLRNQHCDIYIPFEKRLLRLTQYPPDANHGMHIPAAVVIVDTNERSYKTNSNQILVALPVPDFSMPFNTICFVATAFSLIFGPLQYYSTMWLGPEISRPGQLAKIRRLILLAIIIFCLYAHHNDISLNEVRRNIEQYVEKLNELH